MIFPIAGGALIENRGNQMVLAHFSVDQKRFTSKRSHPILVIGIAVCFATGGFAAKATDSIIKVKKHGDAVCFCIVGMYQRERLGVEFSSQPFCLPDLPARSGALLPKRGQRFASSPLMCFAVPFWELNYSTSLPISALRVSSVSSDSFVSTVQT